jgi:tubulin polyglutamylase TTLL9
LDNFYDNIKFNKNHDDDKIYILKKNTHRKQGLQLFRGTKLAVLREYEEGQYKLIQEFIQNPYLVNNRIMVVRLYLVIFRNEKYNYGVHKYGKCLYTSKDFNLDKIETERLITDSKLKLGEDFPKNLTDMENYDKKINLELLKKPIVNVLNCYRQFLKKTDDSTPNKSLTFFQLFGVDIILDSDYKPYLLEINKSPDMNNIYDEVDREGKTGVIRDMKEFIDKGNSNFIFV